MHKCGIMSACGVCPSVRLTRSWIMSKRITSTFFQHPSGSHTILVFFHTKRGGDIPTGTPLTGASNAGGVGRNRDPEPISGFTACFEAFQRQVQAATDHDEFITLVAGKRPSSLMAGNIDEVCDKKPQCYAKDNVTQW